MGNDPKTTHTMIFMEEGRLYPYKKKKKYNCTKNMKGYLMEFYVEYLKELYENHNELPFLAERVNIIRREEKLVPNLRDKLGYVVHIKKLNQALWHSLKF